MTSKRIVPGVLIVAAIAVLAIIMSSGDDGYTVKAAFKDSAGLRKNSSVKVDGVVGGTVTKLDLGPGDLAIATLHLDKGVTVGDGARANVRPVNLLGEKYVELIPGDFRNKPWASGQTIPAKDTSAPVELDQVLDILRPNTRAALRILINEAGIGMAGRGSDFNDLLDRLPPTLDQTKQVIGSFAADTTRLGHLVEQGDRVLASVTGKRDDLNRLVDQAGQALQETADKRAELGQSVQEAGPTAQQLRSTLTTLNTTATNLVPAARDLRATTGPLLDTLNRVPSFVTDTQPLLHTATDVSPDLRRLGTKAAPTVRRLKPTAKRLATFANRLAPVVKIADQAGGLDGLLGVMNGWVKTIQNSDGLGHVFRLRLQLDDTVTGHLLDSLGLNTPKTKRKAKADRNVVPLVTTAPSAPAASQAPTTTSTGPKLTLPQITLPKLPIPEIPGTTIDDQLRNPQKSAGDAGKLLDYLLGG